ncbi:unnamed protein product [Cylicocyclus nassatus]|uniref:Uncharacterized protein n=1 Tax=Cylicocyclus nassatus TaxID=53992 RepID=A0AA36GJW4_CYLNA|nr:unnamed protein product [Cylicocyclus nassatus]
MTTTIRAYKGLVTKRNDVALNWLQESAQLLQRIEQGGVAAQRERAKEIMMDITTCEEYIDLLEASVTKLTKAFDGLQDATDEEEDQLDKLVVFTDASQYAIAACAYLTSQEESNIIMAKSKLPSIKTSMTIPKLEMNALTLGVRMSRFICEMLEPSCKIKEVILYTDSDIVLGWIRTPPSRQSAGILVTNRLSEIRRISNDLRSQSTTCLFGHVSTAENPADCGTRGLSAEALQNHIWWTGPEFTNKPDHSKLSTVADFEQSTMMSVEAVTLNSSEEVSKDEVVDLSRYSTLEKAQRVLVYALRFINRSLSHFPHEGRLAIQQHIPALKEISPSQTITGIEMHEGRMCLIRDHQKNYVKEHQIKSQKELNIRQDEKGILRCYGRLQQADVPVTAETPIYIAPKTMNKPHLLMSSKHSRSRNRMDDDGTRSVYLLSKRYEEERHSQTRSIYLTPTMDEQGRQRRGRKGSVSEAKTHDEVCVRERRGKGKGRKKKSGPSKQSHVRSRGSKGSIKSKNGSSGSLVNVNKLQRQPAKPRKTRSKGKAKEKRKSPNRGQLRKKGSVESRSEDDEPKPVNVRKQGLSAENLQRAIALVNRHHEAVRKKEEERLSRERSLEEERRRLREEEDELFKAYKAEGLKWGFELNRDDEWVENDDCSGKRYLKWVMSHMRSPKTNFSGDLTYYMAFALPDTYPPASHSSIYNRNFYYGPLKNPAMSLTYSPCYIALHAL